MATFFFFFSLSGRSTDLRQHGTVPCTTLFSWTESLPTGRRSSSPCLLIWRFGTCFFLSMSIFACFLDIYLFAYYFCLYHWFTFISIRWLYLDSNQEQSAIRHFCHLVNGIWFPCISTRWRTALSRQWSPKISAWCFTRVTQSSRPLAPSGTSSAPAASGPRRGLCNLNHTVHPRLLSVYIYFLFFYLL